MTVEGLVVDELNLKKDGLVVGELELKKDLDGFLSNIYPFYIHLVRYVTSALSVFKIKGEAPSMTNNLIIFSVLLEDYFGAIMDLGRTLEGFQG